MKNLLYILLVLTTQVFFAQSEFDKANELYRKDKFEAAIKDYESILKTKKQSAELYFNLGNCYYKMNKVAPAIYNYEKALLLNPNDKAIQNNLKFAQKMQIDEIKEKPKVGFHKMIIDFTATYHYDTWAWIAVALSAVFLLLFLGFYFSPITFVKRTFFTLMFFTLVGIALSTASGITERNAYRNDHPAIVFAEIVAVKAEPKADSQDAFLLHEGTKVTVVERLDNWRKVTLANETEGWVDQSAIKEVK